MSVIRFNPDIYLIENLIKHDNWEMFQKEIEDVITLDMLMTMVENKKSHIFSATLLHKNMLPKSFTCSQGPYIIFKMVFDTWPEKISQVYSAFSLTVKDVYKILNLSTKQDFSYIQIKWLQDNGVDCSNVVDYTTIEIAELEKLQTIKHC